MSDKVKKKYILTSQQMLTLKEVFINNGWGINEEPDFDEFCKYLEHFNEEQQDLLIELTKKFLLIDCGIKSFESQIVDTINTLLLHPLATEREDIWVCPMIDPAKSNCNSTYHLVYSLKSMNRTKRGIRRNISIIETPIESKSFYSPEKTLVCMFDDFIGSGETAISSAQYLIENGYQREDILVLSIVGQKEGLASIGREGIAALACIERDRGISDSGSNVPAKTRIMEEIEDIIKPKKKWKFGYQRTEALVKMMRTPNNTFPVFWLPKSKNKVGIDAPFLRT